MPPDAARPRTHTHRALTLEPCGISRARTPPLGGARQPSPGSRGWGRGERLGPGPRVGTARPLASPSRRAGSAPGAATPQPAGVPAAPGARRAGRGGGGRGAAGSGPRGGSAPRRGKFGRGKLPPARPAERRGRAGAGRGHPGSPCGGRLAPRAACRAAPAGQGAPSRPGSLPSAAIRPPLPRHPAPLPRGAARGCPRSCRFGTLRAADEPARAGESGARRPPGGAGGRAGARGGAAAACARVCVSERARE